MKKETILQLISGLIAALFFYAAISKLIDYDKSAGEMRNQIFPLAVAKVLAWLIPVTEIVLSFLLLSTNTRKKTLWASLFLLAAFTLYIAIVMTGVFGRTPCSCGGILKNMGYGTHLIFNFFFIAICLIGLGLEDNWRINNRLLNLKTERNWPDIE